jgi:hypothetical protein
MATTIRDARGEVSFAKFLFLPSWFAKLLETSFSYFAKIIWMPSWFAKLLELLLVIYSFVSSVSCFLIMVYTESGKLLT